MGVRISDLPTANTMTDADYLEAEVSGDSRKVTPPTILDGSGYFSTTTGHDHDGVDSKKIDKEDVIGLTSSDTPTFSTVKLTDLSDGYIPYHSSDLVGLVDGVLKTDADDAISKKHNRQHSITSSSDHTSTATQGKILKADANGLPVDATNTDIEVSTAVTKTHDRSHALDSTSDHTGGSISSGKVPYYDGSKLADSTISVSGGNTTVTGYTKLSTYGSLSTILSSSGNVTTSHQLYYLNPASGEVIASLPDASSCDGMIVTFVRVCASRYNAIIKAASNQYIGQDYAWAGTSMERNSMSLDGVGETIKLQSNGTSRWCVIE